MAHEGNVPNRHDPHINATAATSVPPTNVEIDRIAPTLRPQGRTVMRQQWRDLLFLHWSIPVAQLRPLIPAALDLDTYGGRAYVGLVPFTMRNVRPSWSPPFAPLSNFHEINVRTYVHRNGHNPGVWFFSLDAANSIAVRIARAWFKLPYFYARMDLKKSGDLKKSRDLKNGDEADDPTIAYATDRLWPEPTPAQARVQWTPHGAVRHAEPGTLDHFLVERYLLYSFQPDSVQPHSDQAGSRKGQLFCGQVHHAAYPIRSAKVHHLDENLIAQAGITRSEESPLIHCARGVDVDIYPLRKVE